MGWRDPGPALPQKNGAKTGGKGEERSEGGGNLALCRGNGSCAPPPEPNWGGKGGGKEREKGVQWGRGLVKPPELIKPPPWVVNPQVTRPRPGSEGCREQHPQSGGALHH